MVRATRLQLQRQASGMNGGNSDSGDDDADATALRARGEALIRRVMVTPLRVMPLERELDSSNRILRRRALSQLARTGNQGAGAECARTGFRAQRNKDLDTLCIAASDQRSA